MKRNTFTAILVLALVLIMGTALVSCKNEPKLPIAPLETVDHVVDETLLSFLTCIKYIDDVAKGPMDPQEIATEMENGLISSYEIEWELEEGSVSSTVDVETGSIVADVHDVDNINDRDFTFNDIKWDATEKASCGSFEISAKGRFNGATFTMTVKGTFDFAKDDGEIVYSSVTYLGKEYDVQRFNEKIW